ncbi:hypothetical protein ACTFIY_007853 [Dictyostelium cf. discoideum]
MSSDILGYNGKNSSSTTQPLPDKILDPISPQPIEFNIKELDTPTQEKIVNDMLLQPDQTIYIPLHTPTTSNSTMETKLKINKTIEEEIENHLKQNFNDLTHRQSSAKRKFHEENNQENDLEQVSTIMNNNLQKIDKNLSISITK